MAATKANPIVFYDIFSNQGPWSPNTYKTRYGNYAICSHAALTNGVLIRLTLNYKRLPYRVEYVSLADVESKLKELVIADPSSEPGGTPTYVVESFDIAVYLDDKYPSPEYPAVFPRGTRAMQHIATGHISQTVMLIAPVILPLASLRTDLLDERGMEYFTRTRSAIFGTELPKLLDKALENWNAAEARWDRINEVFDFNQGGPYMMGHQISFIDFVIGGAILMVQKLEGGEMSYWEKMAGWHGGRWAALWRGIAKLEADSSEVV
ncbi:hypothetical protein FRC10_009222 [Ceratobasidium sp. 414]|nr:hypothetical protein FRC10_009222 [Ceratobasidium sp. 414]